MPLMMDTERYEHLLERRGIRPTAVRLLVLDALVSSGLALSMTDVERLLDTVDKSSVFRAMTLFHEKHLIHAIDDGSGMLKYALCHHDELHDCSVADLHAHFRCTGCGKTFCLDRIPIPKVDLPGGFVLDGMNFVLMGLCPDCSRS